MKSDIEAENTLLLGAINRFITTENNTEKDVGKTVGVPLNDVEGRYTAGKSALKVGDFATALKELLWCYDNGMLVSNSHQVIRNSFLVYELRKLATVYPEAKVALVQRLQAAEQAILRGVSDRSVIEDIVGLSSALGDSQRIVRLFDSLAPDDPRRTYIPPIRLIEPLVAAGRYEDAGSLMSYEKVVKSLDSGVRLSRNSALPAQRQDETRLLVVKEAIGAVDIFSRTGRVDDARNLAAKISLIDPSPATADALSKSLQNAGVKR